MSLSLAHLPLELVCCIVANVPSRSTLCNLSRCSRQLYLCTRPHLYRYITIQEGIGQHDEQLRNIASLLLSRPDLAVLVRHFALHVDRPSETYTGGEFEEPEDDGRAKMSEVYQSLAAAVRPSSFSEKEMKSYLGQFSQTHPSYFDLILALLLPALLRVKILVLDLKIGFDLYYLEHMLQRAACREPPFNIQPPFEALAVVVHPQDMFSTAFIASLLKFPAIQKISGGFESTSCFEREVRTSTGGNLMELDSFSSSLTSLHLAACRLTMDLVHVLRAPKALKTLSYRLCPPAYDNFTHILCQALEPQKNCLEKLELDCHRVYDGNRHFLRPMPSFISFSSLKVFKAATALFLRSPKNVAKCHRLLGVFPPSLDMLHMTRFEVCSKSLLEALEHLLAQKSPLQIPLLKRLILEETKPFRSRYEERPATLMDVVWEGCQETVIERLSRLTAAHDVSLSIVEESTGDDLLLREWEA